ncbi:hypothetical protein ABIE18_004454 [Arthrobacter sp. 2762]
MFRKDEDNAFAKAVEGGATAGVLLGLYNSLRRAFLVATQQGILA